MYKNRNAFTMVELLAVMAIVALLVFLAVPKLMGYTKEARLAQLTYDAKLLENACEMYYLANGDWPRASDTPYTAEQIAAFTQKVYDQRGMVITLDPEGSYYDLDMTKLSKYVTINEDPKNFILQNPVGSIYVLDPQTNTRIAEKAGAPQGEPPKEEPPAQKPVAVITMTPDQGLLTTTVITWSYANSYDPNGGSIVNAEWQGKQDVYPTEGQYTVQLRVQNDKGVWSDWAEKTFTVAVPKPVAAIQMTPAAPTAMDFVSFTTTGSSFTDTIIATEWVLDGGVVQASPPNGQLAQGSHTVLLRIKDAGGWSDWTSLTFNVSPFTFSTNNSQAFFSKIVQNGYTFDHYNRKITWSPTGIALNVRLAASNFGMYLPNYGYSTTACGFADVYNAQGQILLSYSFSLPKNISDVLYWDFTLPANASYILVYTSIQEPIGYPIPTGYYPNVTLTLR